MTRAPERILVCKVGGLGDGLSMLPALDLLRRARPRAVITFLCGPAVAALLPPGWGLRVVTVERGRLSGAAGLSRVPALVRAVGPQDEVFLSHDECTCVHLVARLTAPRRTGFAAGVARGEALLTDRLPFDPDLGPYHLAARLVSEGADLPRPALATEVPAAWLAAHDGQGPYGVVHPGAALELRRWSLSHFREVARRMAERTGHGWLLVDERQGLSLRQLAGLIGGARGFVGNHSGPLHLAAALGVPWVAVAGPTARAWDPPWPGLGVVVRPDLPCTACARVGQELRTCPRDTPGACMEAVRPDVVVEALVSVMERAEP